jgi:Tfp pilus assembly protein PilP
MFNQAKKIAWLIFPLCVAGTVTAQEKIETALKKTEHTAGQLQATPGSVGKTVQTVKKSVGANFGSDAAEVKTAKATSQPAPVLGAPMKNDETQSSNSTVIGSRDPFRPFTLNKVRPGGPRKNLSPLERYDLGQLKLVGVIWDVKEPNAMVEDAAGLGYVVRVGTPIGSNEGKVKAIQSTAIVVEEFEINVFGAKKKVERNMRLAPEKAE